MLIGFQTKYAIPLALILCPLLGMSNAEAQDVAAIANLDVKSNDKLIEPKAPAPDNQTAIVTNLPKTLDTEQNVPHLTKVQAKQYLQQNPQLLEHVLSIMIRNNDADGIQDLLPLYSSYPKRDESLIDWGNAIIAMKQGDIKKSVGLFRKINSALPNIKLVRFQLALALYQDKQFDAAKSELIKLRSNSDLTQNDVKAINQYIEILDKKDRWNVNFGLSYLDDKNITNAPKVGTSIDGLSLTSKHQEGQGIGYSASADKKYFYNNNFFTAVHLNTNGSYYWNNKDFNDVTAGVGLGLGYQDSKREIEIVPKFSNRWYGLGTLGDGDLHNYSNTKGVGFNFSNWMNTHWLYQNYSEYNHTNYENPYQINDGKFTLFSNTLMYLPTQRRYFYTALDYLKKKAPAGDEDQSFDRKGIRIGWGEAWDKGISTKLSVGFAKKDYDATSRFTQIQGKDKDYDATFSIWKRDWYLLGLTPRLSWQYTKVKSNDPFNEYDKNTVNLEFTKTF